MELKIDQQFKNLIPPLSDDEFSNLEQSILTEGCRDALVTWNGYLIDGHNRYAACTKHNLPFKTIEKQFDSRDDVSIWMIRNQKGRRNVSTYVMVGLGLKLEELLKQKGLKNKVTNSFDKLVEKEKVLPQKSAEPLAKNRPVETRKEIANFANTSYDTVSKVKEIINKSPTEVKDELEKKINSSDISINQAHKFVRAVNGNAEVAKRILSEFNKNTRGSLENKTKEVIREVQKEERANLLREFEEKENMEVEKIEESFMVKCELGNWYQLGDNLLYCGDNTDRKFVDKLKEYPIKYAFADPPYNANVDEWDSGFIWTQDYLTEYAEIVIVTPGIVSVKDFMRRTEMPYKWSMSGTIENGHARGAMGFGNWIYLALFSKGSVFINSQDISKIVLTPKDNDITRHKGRKPRALINELMFKFTKEGEYLLDPFLGSGTSLFLAEEGKRKCIGAELSVDFCNDIVRDWEKQSCKKAVLICNPMWGHPGTLCTGAS